LDAKLRVEMRVEISQLHHRLGSTMIYVTHDQVEAMTMGQRIVVMKDGIVQQVADPITLYDQPANRFVAGFIGTPPMNFFEGRLADTNGGLTFEGPGDMHIPVEADVRRFLEPYRTKGVVLGIRPEDIGSAAAEALAGAPRINACVEVVEPMGAESYVHLRAGSTGFISRVDAHRRFQVGQAAENPVFSPKAHYFDPHSGKAIC